MFKSHSGSLLLVSHDRNFLDALCNTIFEIEAEKVNIYRGNYSKYLELKKLEKERQNAEYINYKTERLVVKLN